MNKLQVSALAAIATSILVACGGGKSSSDSTSNASGPVKLTGVVSTGSPTANPLTTTNKVTAKCLNTSGGTTQSVVNVLADGSYEVTLADSSLPCVLQVDTPQKMASLAQGTGPGTAVANITPVTTLVVAKVAGKDPVQFFAEFGAGTAAVITNENENAAITIVRDVVAKAGVSLTGVVNVFTDTVDKNASLASTPPYDLAVAKLAETIRTAGITLEIVSLDVSTLSSSSSGSNGVAASSSGVASLPADRLLKPAAATCAALRSGDYVSIDLAPDTTVTAGSAPIDTIAYITIDASTTPIQAVDTGGTGTIIPGTLDPVSGDPCRFVVTGGNREFVIAQSGVMVGRFTHDGGLTYRASIGFPRQTLTLTDIAGTWNVINFETNGSLGNVTYTPKAGVATFDAFGAISSAFCFDQAMFPISASACPAESGPFATITSHADGGFNLTDTGTPGVGGSQTSRIFGFRAGGGELMAVLISADGSFDILTRQRTLTLPTVGAVSTFWNVNIAANGLSPTTAGAAGLPATGFQISTNTVMSASASNFTRDQSIVGASPTNRHTESLQINTPRIGYTHRNEGLGVATQATPPGTTNYSEFVNLNLRGMGLNALVVRPPSTIPTGTPTFVFSVNK